MRFDSCSYCTVESAASTYTFHAFARRSKTIRNDPDASLRCAVSDICFGIRATSPGTRPREKPPVETSPVSKKEKIKSKKEKALRIGREELYSDIVDSAKFTNIFVLIFVIDVAKYHPFVFIPN